MHQARVNTDGMKHRETAATRSIVAMGTAMLLLVLTGCGISVPADPDGSLQRVVGDELRVGVAAEPDISTAADQPQGPLPDLARDFAETLHANTTWTVASEESLVRMIESGEIDLALGDFSPQTPWSDRVAISRPFAAPEGTPAPELVAFLPLGENAFVSEFETYLDETGVSR